MGKRDTQRGFGDPAESGEATPPPGSLRHPAPLMAPMEIEHVRETGSPALLSGPWRAFEIWTQNRIYGIDATMTCREVIDRTTGSPSADHPALGQRLLGGQIRDSEGRITQVSHPLPNRGAMAIFASGFGKRLLVSETSSVTRVVVRQRVVDVDAPPSWEEITGDTGS